ncbi:MAG: HD domain-containing protein [SAR324 cluster bacterium]|nr:HD domain-containing protein [SAR324 cluster bacterium]
MSASTKIVPIKQLKDNMKILAFTGFSTQYLQLGENSCKFIQLNFKGATFKIARNGKKMDCKEDDLQPNDRLLKITDFPDTLRKFTTVTPRLIEELQKRGFLEFEVMELPKQKTQQEKHRESVEEANVFVQQVKESIEMREQATDAVKDMMDGARLGKIKTEGVKVYIENMMKSSSAEAMQTLASLKQSDQTYAHCVDAAAIFQNAYYEMKRLTGEKPVFADVQMTLFAGFMHDCGKSKVPKDILESTARFERESREMHLLQSHTVFGAKILEEMGMPSQIVNIAHYHHVKMDTSLNSSYPQNVKYDDVLMETRLASIVDVYQALIGRRSYKKSWPPAAAMRYIDALTGVEFDPNVWDLFMKVLGKYPKGSLVQLNDNSMAFVISVPTIDLNRPKVVVVRDAQGNNVSKYALIDLEVEKNMNIVKDLDHYDIFGDQALDIFLQIQAM